MTRTLQSSGRLAVWRVPLVALLVVAGAACGRGGSSGSADGGEPDRVVGGPQGAVGQFVVECTWSHANFDDPIVQAGMAGMSHRHEFFGNTTTDADSTYDTMVVGATTCDQRLDTASYWVPSLLDDNGVPVEPVGAVAYYRAGLGVDPSRVEPYPAGLMLVGGHADATERQPTSVVAWSCGPGGRRAAAPPGCPGDQDEGLGLRLWVTFPDCWDGEHLDSEDHHSHVAYSHDGACGDEHSTPVPQLQLAVDYPPDDSASYSLASGPTYTAHADFWNTWNQDKLSDEVALCLVRNLVCGVSRTDSRRF